MKALSKSKLAAAMGAGFLAASLSSTVSAQGFDMGNGWKGNVGLQLQTFVVSGDESISNAEATRVMSGFDPSKLTIGVTAPETDGVTVSGTYQLVSSIHGAQASGKGDGSPGKFGVRVAELAIAGDFGTVKAGRGWGIFSSSSLIHDSGSLPGVGGVCKGGDFGTVDGNGFGGCGRIGYGYQWTDFAPAVQYASNNFGGVSFRVGLFDPISSGAAGDSAESPRFEGEVNFNSKAFDVWASFANQSTEGDEEISAVDVGGEFRIAGLALTAAYTKGTGIEGGFMSPNDPDLDTSFWYAEADYKIGKLLIGASYGENEDEFSGTVVEEGALTMFFVHYNLTPNTTLVLEISNEENEILGTKTFDQDIIALGAQIVF